MAQIDDSNDNLLHGDTFFLRPWRIEDAEWYVKSRDEIIFRWTKESRNLTVEEAEAAIREANSKPGIHCFAIVESVTGCLAGNIALVPLGSDISTAEIMYWIAPEKRGRGLATKSLRLLTDWAFRSIGLERVILKTHPDNVASQRAARRAGFRKVIDTDSKRSDTEYVWFERPRSN